MRNLDKYSFGIGDRFGCQGEALLKAFFNAKEKGVSVAPVWNKSNREHLTVNTEPLLVRQEADDAVNALKWSGNYYVDADHITFETVDRYIDCSDFFTIDVAQQIGERADQSAIDEYFNHIKSYIGTLAVPGIDEQFEVSETYIRDLAAQYLLGAQKAKQIYEHIKSQKGSDYFAVEVSMDEVDEPQVPRELFFILSMLAYYNVPLDTIAPKFSGRFNKGIDYEGEIAQFEKEFENDLLVIDFAVKSFGLKSNLKLSVHTGSDKFSIYPIINKLIHKHDKGIHVKTAGTTWLAEMEALAASGGEGLSFCKKIYKQAYDNYEALTKPYSTVINVDPAKLPSVETVNSWSGAEYNSALTHDPENDAYNPHLRQLIHVAYKIAGQNMSEYLGLLESNKQKVSSVVTNNIWEKHLSKIFV